MSEIRLSRLLSLDGITGSLDRKKTLPSPDSYYFIRNEEGELKYVIPDGQVSAGVVEQRIAINLQKLMGQVQEQLSNKPKP